MYDELVATMRRQCVEMSCGNCGTCVNRQAADAIEELSKRVPVPPHGRLIDADALWAEINKICDRRDAGIITDLNCIQQLLSAARLAPTVIEAEEGE